MRFFLDSSSVQNVKKWKDFGVIQGVTMNPIILKREGVTDVQGQIREILAGMAPMPVSIQVTSSTDRDIMAEAEQISALGDNAVVKVPVIGSDGRLMFGVIDRLASARIDINATACMTSLQAIAAAMAGARYVSLFAGRIEDEGGSAAEQIEMTRAWIDEVGSGAEIIVGSLRQPYALYTAMRARAHILTVPPEALQKALDHSNGRRTVAEFEDAARALSSQGTHNG